MGGEEEGFYNKGMNRLSNGEGDGAKGGERG